VIVRDELATIPMVIANLVVAGPITQYSAIKVTDPERRLTEHRFVW